MAGHSDKFLEGMQAPSIDSLLDYSEEVSLSIFLFVVVVMMNLLGKKNEANQMFVQVPFLPVPFLISFGAINDFIICYIIVKQIYYIVVLELCEFVILLWYCIESRYDCKQNSCAFRTEVF